MYWQPDSIINSRSPYASPSDVFKEVCSAIANVYTTKGFKYRKSVPSISKSTNDFDIEIAFSSSRKNTPGQYSCLEILPRYIYKKVTTERFPKGLYLIGHNDLFTEMTDGNPGTVLIKQIFGETLEREDPYQQQAVIIQNNACNVMHLTEENFEKILAFIDYMSAFIEKVYSFDFLLAFVNKKTKGNRECLLGRNTAINAPSFVQFIKNKFSDDQFQELLNALERDI